MKFKDKTRGGHPLTLYTTEAGDDRPVHGRIVACGKVMLLSWAANGRWWPNAPHSYDLLPLREPSEAAVEAAFNEFWAAPSKAFEDIRRALRAAYEIDFPEGGA